jgi:SAM-dependent methyltransferase
MMVNQNALRMVRRSELELIASRLPRGGKILEIGGGSGWQSAELAARGFEVISVDVAANPYKQEWEVITYNGRDLPFPDATFDAVFSSNVLEHVDDVAQILGECARVVRVGGVAVHLMPTAVWRWWTSLNHYPWLIRTALELGRGALPAGIATSASLRPGKMLARLMFAPRHGEVGSVLGELFRFSPRFWRKELEGRGWHLHADAPAGLLYSGYFVSYPIVGESGRRRLARWFGSACHVYLLHRISQ